MQTVQIDLTQSEWVEILAGNNALAIQITTANRVRLHFSNSATAPDFNSPSILVDSFPPRWDFECQSQVGQSHVWARGDNGDAQIIVVRRQ
jgi:hypothetical protein